MDSIKKEPLNILNEKYIEEISLRCPIKQKMDRALKLTIPKFINRMKMDTYYPLNSITKPFWKL